VFTSRSNTEREKSDIARTYLNPPAARQSGLCEEGVAFQPRGRGGSRQPFTKTKNYNSTKPARAPSLPSRAAWFGPLSLQLSRRLVFLLFVFDCFPPPSVLELLSSPFPPLLTCSMPLPLLVVAHRDVYTPRAAGATHVVGPRSVAPRPDPRRGDRLVLS